MKTWTRRRILLWVAISIVPLIHSLIRKAESRFRGNRLFQVYIGCIQSELDLVDIWRVKNPSTKSYTCSQKSPNIFCRLDFWLISNNFIDYLVKSVDVIPSIKTDHAAITLDLQNSDNEIKGPSLEDELCSSGR